MKEITLIDTLPSMAHEAGRMRYPIGYSAGSHSIFGVSENDGIVRISDGPNTICVDGEGARMLRDYLQGFLEAIGDE